MPTKKNIMGTTDWSYKSETIDRLPDGVFSIGIGQGLADETGLTNEDIAQLLGSQVTQLTNGGMNKLCLQFNGNTFDIYARQRGKAVEFGSRQDFKELGWAAACDELDRQYP